VTGRASQSDRMRGTPMSGRGSPSTCPRLNYNRSIFNGREPHLRVLKSDQTHWGSTWRTATASGQREPVHLQYTTGHADHNGSSASGRFLRWSRGTQTRSDALGAYDWTRNRVRPSLRFAKPPTSAYVSLTELTPRMSGHNMTPRPVTQQTEPESATSFKKWPDAEDLESSHFATCVRKLIFSENQLLHFTNFFTLA
jgi:hypothetical protein